MELCSERCTLCIVVLDRLTNLVLCDCEMHQLLKKFRCDCVDMFTRCTRIHRAEGYPNNDEQLFSLFTINKNKIHF